MTGLELVLKPVGQAFNVVHIEFTVTAALYNKIRDDLSDLVNKGAEITVTEKRDEEWGIDWVNIKMELGDAWDGFWEGEEYR